jgi:hypothetical protein
MARTDDEQEPLILAFSPDDDDDTLPHINDDNNVDDDYDDYEDEGDLASSLPALSSSVVFILLLAPCLKLGAMSLATNPFPYGIASVLVFGVLSFFSRQLLYLLSRYLRTGELGEHLASFALAHVLIENRGPHPGRIRTRYTQGALARYPRHHLSPLH